MGLREGFCLKFRPVPHTKPGGVWEILWGYTSSGVQAMFSLVVLLTDRLSITARCNYCGRFSVKVYAPPISRGGRG
jgi:hypothetical protein